MDKYKLQDRGNGTAELLMYEDIGADFFGGIAAIDVVRELSNLKAREIDVRINSQGGDVFDGVAIYNALNRHSARVRTHNDGLAASIASVIMLAGDEVHMADNAMMMIHSAWTITSGNADDLEGTVSRLRQIDDMIVSTYASRTGMDAAEIRPMMAAETWFNAAEAKTAGFVDTISDAMHIAAHADSGRFRNWPKGFGAKQVNPEAEAEKRRTERLERVAGLAKRVTLDSVR